MEFAEFAQILVTRLELEKGVPLEPSTGVFDDLGVDSFQAFEMLLVIESMASLDVPPPELPDIFTLGDAYEYFQTACELARREG